MIRTLTELAKLVNGEIIGDGQLEITGVSDLEAAKPGDITFLVDVQQYSSLSKTKASAAVVSEANIQSPIPVLKVKDPYLAMALIHNIFLERSFTATGIHPSSHVGENCQLSSEISIGPMSVIGDRVKIGDRVIIHPGVVIGDDAQIGDDTEIHANVCIGHKCKLGNRIIIHAGTVIGADGFGYATDQNGRHVKRPQVGIVQIDDDVEIGANSCVDRATFGRTWIKSGCKIDNLVQVAHNVEIGDNSLIVSQAGIAGSSKLGSGVILGGQVGVSGHLTLGNRVMAGAKSGIHNNLPDNEVVSGYPAFSHKLWLKACAVIPRLPELFKDVRALKRQINK